MSFQLQISRTLCFSVLLLPSREEQNLHSDCALSVLLLPSRKEQNLHFDCKFCLCFVSIAFAQQESAEPTLQLQVLPVLCQYCFCPAGKNRTYILTASFASALSVLLLPSRNLRKEQNLHFDCPALKKAEPTFWLLVLPALFLGIAFTQQVSNWISRMALPGSGSPQGNQTRKQTHTSNKIHTKKPNSSPKMFE